MESILSIGTSVSTPLALGGFVAASLLYIAKRIVSKDYIRTLTTKHSADVLKLIIDRFFVLALVSMALGFAAFLATKLITPTADAVPSSPTNVVGSGNITVSGANNTVTINTDLSAVLKAQSKIRKIDLPLQRANHKISVFEFQEVVPSIQIGKINALIRSTVMDLYKRNNFYEGVTITATTRFIDYGLLGISIDIVLEKIDPQVLRDVGEQEALFLMFMASAHSLEKSTGLVINISNGEPYEFKDLFRFNSIPKVSAIMKTILEKNEMYFPCGERIPGNDFDLATLERFLGYSAEGCFAEVHPNANFFLTADSIVVKYSRYQIGPGYLGAPEVTIPFEEIRGYLNPNGPLSFVSLTGQGG